MKKYPDVSRIEPKEITIELLKKMLDVISIKKKQIVITPINLMKLNGAPVSNQFWMLNQKLRIKKIKKLLIQLQKEGILEKRALKQEFKGIREVGYNIIRKSIV